MPATGVGKYPNGGVIESGTLYCSYKDCPFQVRFNYDKNRFLHYVREKNFCVTHSSQCANGSVSINGTLFVNRESELTPEEFSTLFSLAALLDASSIRSVMMHKFPDRQYSGPLIQRLRGKAREVKYGKDKDAIKSFMELGKSEEAKGGVFSCRFDESMRLTDVVFMPALMAQYAKKYSDLTMLDGTFKVNMYDMVLVLASNIDCLGKSTITSLFLSPTENSRVCIDGLMKCGLAKPGATLMTDGAASFVVAANAVDMNHVLCVKHYATTLLGTHAGMNDAVHKSYLSDALSLLYDVFPSTKQCNDLLHQYLETYKMYPKALQWLTQLEENKHKICATFTSPTFTAGHCTTQRSESNNARIKQNDTQKLKIARNMRVSVKLSIM
ncbi:hypothetical protein AeMF1_014778 [Aphanomyces euteiches]|nr:hypothetical protein AeMF1_014778 [Aphanomyces euteiches]